MGIKMQEKEQSTVLVVDDHPVNRMILRKMLQECGAQVEEAADGKTAVKMIQKKEYDVVFLDCVMPEWDGIRTAQEIRALPGREKKPVIVAVSGERRKEQEDALRQAGVAELFVKPVTVAQIGKYLKKVPAECIAREERKSLALKKAVYETLTEQAEILKQEPGECCIRACHTLKGLLATIGERALSDDFAALLQMLRDGQYLEYRVALPDGIKGLQQLLDQQRKQLCEEEGDMPDSADGVKKAPDGAMERMAGEKEALDFLRQKQSELMEAFRIFDYEKIMQCMDDMAEHSTGRARQTIEECRRLAGQFRYEASKECFLKLINE